MKRRPRGKGPGQRMPRRKVARGRKLPPRVVVKFKDEMDGDEQHGMDSPQVQMLMRFKRSLTEQFPSTRMTRLFYQSPEQLRSLVDRAVATDPTYERVNLASYFAVEVPVGNPELVVRYLDEQREFVEQAYVEPGFVAPPQVQASNNPLRMKQGYLNAAPEGIDAEFAWKVPGGMGAGVNFMDLEQGWVLGHDDLKALGITKPLSGTNSEFFSHGTSALGVVASVDNAVGCIGITPALASVGVVSQWRTGDGYSTAQPILDVLFVRGLGFGDVLLLEAQTDLWDYKSVPVEIEPVVFDVIRLATALGVVVVEASGNGGVDLDSVKDPQGRQIFNRTGGLDAGFRDSGAIIVGAASSALPHVRLPFSCHGSRIDCYGWGKNVATAASDAKGIARSRYTRFFGGTSSASAIVAGAALSTQGMASVQDQLLSPTLLRTILSDRSLGTPSGAPGWDRIGVMPDLKAIARRIPELKLDPDTYHPGLVGDVGQTDWGLLL